MLLFKRSQAAQNSIVAAIRCFSTGAAFSDRSLQLQRNGVADDAVLVTLVDRQWGPLNAINQNLVQDTTNGQLPQKIAIARSAYATSDAEQAAIGSLLRPLPEVNPEQGPMIAVSSHLTSPLGKHMVSEYVLDEANHRYTIVPRGTQSGTHTWTAGSSMPLLSYLAAHGHKAVVIPAESSVFGGAGEPAVGACVPSAGKGWGAGRVSNRQVGEQSTNRVLMVAPTAFEFNTESAEDNAFMGLNTATSKGAMLRQHVLEEHVALFDELTERAGVQVDLFSHNDAHRTPDAVFPNNWFSTHATTHPETKQPAAQFFLFPMRCPSRARERRQDMISTLCQTILPHAGLDVSTKRHIDIHDFSRFESMERYLEGTGALVLDRVNQTAYMSLSDRSDPYVGGDWTDEAGIDELVVFKSYDVKKQLVYHTNVVMWVGSEVAMVCAEAILDDKERKELMDMLSRHHTVIPISMKQMTHFAGNAIELLNHANQPVVFMSDTAYNSLDADQLHVLRAHVAHVHHVPFSTIERVGGGGVRCAIAEIF